MISLDIKTEGGEEIPSYFNVVHNKLKTLFYKTFGDRDLARETKRQLTGGSLNKRTGNLLNKTYWKKEGSGDNLELSLYTTRYGAFLNKGGKIKAKNASFLTIPIAAEAQGKSARDFPDSVLIKSRKGNLIIASISGYGPVKPLFLLRKSVNIPAFNWIDNVLKNTSFDKYIKI